MSDVGSSGGTGGDEEDRKGKRVRFSDDDKKQTGQQNPSSVPSGLNDEDLSIFHMFSERDGTSLDVLMKQQKQAFHYLNVNKALQKSAKSKPLQEDSDGDAQIDDDNYSSDSDGKKEDLGPVEELLIFELEISDRNRLVIPYATASNHFPPMAIQPDTVETIHLYDPLGRRWTMTLIYSSEAHSYVITNGLNEYIEHNRLNPPDAIRVYLPVPQLSINNFYIQHRKRLGRPLFEMLVPRSNRLRIPYDVAMDYFNPSEAMRLPYQLREFPLQLTDYLNRTWEMRFVCYNDEEAYIVVRGWEEYAAHHSLNHNDKLRFFRRSPRPEKNRFVVHHEMRRRVGSSALRIVKPPLFRQKHCICTMRLSETDVTFGRLEMPRMGLPSGFRDQEMVKLTDVNKKDWYVTLVYTRSSKDLMILDGWDAIVKDHKLEAGDIVRLYEPVEQEEEHDTHFLIGCEKNKKTEKEEGGSGSGKPDDGAGPSSIISSLNLRMKFHTSTTFTEPDESFGIDILFSCSVFPLSDNVILSGIASYGRQMSGVVPHSVRPSPSAFIHAELALHSHLPKKSIAQSLTQKQALHSHSSSDSFLIIPLNPKHSILLSPVKISVCYLAQNLPIQI